MVNYSSVISKVKQQQQDVQKHKTQAKEVLSQLQKKPSPRQKVAIRKATMKDPRFRVKMAQQETQKKQKIEEIKEYQKEISDAEKTLEEQEKTIKKYQKEGYEISGDDESGYKFTKRVATTVRPSYTSRPQPTVDYSAIDAQIASKQQEYDRINTQINNLERIVGRIRVGPTSGFTKILNSLKSRRTAISRELKDLKMQTPSGAQAAITRYETITKTLGKLGTSILAQRFPQITTFVTKMYEKLPEPTFETHLISKGISPSYYEQAGTLFVPDYTSDITGIKYPGKTFTFGKEKFSDMARWIEKSEADIGTAEMSHLISQWKKTEEVPTWYKTELLEEMPDTSEEHFKEVGVLDDLVKSQYQKYLGIYPTQNVPSGFVGPIYDPFEDKYSESFKKKYGYYPGQKSTTDNTTTNYIKRLKNFLGIDVSKEYEQLSMKGLSDKDFTNQFNTMVQNKIRELPKSYDNKVVDWVKSNVDYTDPKSGKSYTAKELEDLGYVFYRDPKTGDVTTRLQSQGEYIEFLKKDIEQRTDGDPWKKAGLLIPAMIIHGHLGLDALVDAVFFDDNAKKMVKNYYAWGTKEGYSIEELGKNKDLMAEYVKKIDTVTLPPGTTGMSPTQLTHIPTTLDMSEIKPAGMSEAEWKLRKDIPEYTGPMVETLAPGTTAPSEYTSARIAAEKGQIFTKEPSQTYINKRTKELQRYLTSGTDVAYGNVLIQEANLRESLRKGIPNYIIDILKSPTMMDFVWMPLMAYTGVKAAQIGGGYLADLSVGGKAITAFGRTGPTITKVGEWTGKWGGRALRWGLPAVMLPTAIESSGREIFSGFEPKRYVATTPTGQYYTASSPGGLAGGLKSIIKVAPPWIAAGVAIKEGQYYTPAKQVYMDRGQLTFGKTKFPYMGKEISTGRQVQALGRQKAFRFFGKEIPYGLPEPVGYEFFTPTGKTTPTALPKPGTTPTVVPEPIMTVPDIWKPTTFSTQTTLPGKYTVPISPRGLIPTGDMITTTPKQQVLPGLSETIPIDITRPPAVWSYSPTTQLSLDRFGLKQVSTFGLETTYQKPEIVKIGNVEILKQKGVDIKNIKVVELNDKYQPSGETMVVSVKGKAKPTIEVATENGDIVRIMSLNQAIKRFQTRNVQTLANRIVNPHVGYNYQTEMYEPEKEISRDLTKERIIEQKRLRRLPLREDIGVSPRVKVESLFTSAFGETKPLNWLAQKTGVRVLEPLPREAVYMGELEKVPVGELTRQELEREIGRLARIKGAGRVEEIRINRKTGELEIKDVGKGRYVKVSETPTKSLKTFISEHVKAGYKPVNVNKYIKRYGIKVTTPEEYYIDVMIDGEIVDVPKNLKKIYEIVYEYSRAIRKKAGIEWDDDRLISKTKEYADFKKTKEYLALKKSISESIYTKTNSFFTREGTAYGFFNQERNIIAVSSKIPKNIVTKTIGDIITKSMHRVGSFLYKSKSPLFQDIGLEMRYGRGISRYTKGQVLTHEAKHYEEMSVKYPSISSERMTYPIMDVKKGLTVPKKMVVKRTPLEAIRELLGVKKLPIEFKTYTIEEITRPEVLEKTISNRKLNKTIKKIKKEMPGISDKQAKALALDRLSKHVYKTLSVEIKRAGGWDLSKPLSEIKNMYGESIVIESLEDLPVTREYRKSVSTWGTEKPYDLRMGLRPATMTTEGEYTITRPPQYPATGRYAPRISELIRGERGINFRMYEPLDMIKSNKIGTNKLENIIDKYKRKIQPALETKQKSIDKRAKNREELIARMTDRYVQMYGKDVLKQIIPKQRGMPSFMPSGHDYNLTKVRIKDILFDTDTNEVGVLAYEEMLQAIYNPSIRDYDYVRLFINNYKIIPNIPVNETITRTIGEWYKGKAIGVGTKLNPKEIEVLNTPVKNLLILGKQIPIQFRNMLLRDVPLTVRYGQTVDIGFGTGYVDSVPQGEPFNVVSYGTTSDVKIEPDWFTRKGALSKTMAKELIMASLDEYSGIKPRQSEFLKERYMRERGIIESSEKLERYFEPERKVPMTAKEHIEEHKRISLGEEPYPEFERRRMPLLWGATKGFEPPIYYKGEARLERTGLEALKTKIRRPGEFSTEIYAKLVEGPTYTKGGMRLGGTLRTDWYSEMFGKTYGRSSRDTYTLAQIIDDTISKADLGTDALAYKQELYRVLGISTPTMTYQQLTKVTSPTKVKISAQEIRRMAKDVIQKSKEAYAKEQAIRAEEEPKRFPSLTTRKQISPTLEKESSQIPKELTAEIEKIVTSESEKIAKAIYKITGVSKEEFEEAYKKAMENIQKEKVVNKEIEKLAKKEINEQTQKNISREISKNISKAIVKNIQKEIQKPISKNIQKQVERQIQRQIERQIQKQIQRQIQRQIQKQIPKFTPTFFPMTFSAEEEIIQPPPFTPTQPTELKTSPTQIFPIIPPQEGEREIKRKRESYPISFGYKEREYKVPEIWKAGTRRPGWVGKKSPAKKSQFFSLTGGRY